MLATWHASQRPATLEFEPGAHWLGLARAIEEHYDAYDGFVVCHGTDTLAYTAAALSYLIQDSAKPVVLTGAQKPISFSITIAAILLWERSGFWIYLSGSPISLT